MDYYLFGAPVFFNSTINSGGLEFYLFGAPVVTNLTAGLPTNYAYFGLCAVPTS